MNFRDFEVVQASIAFASLLEHTGLGTTMNLELAANNMQDRDPNLYAYCRGKHLVLSANRDKDLPTALTEFQEILYIYQQTGNLCGQVQCLTLMADSFGPVEGQIITLLEALSLWQSQSTECMWGKANTLYILAYLSYLDQTIQEASLYIEEALQDFTAIGVYSMCGKLLSCSGYDT